MPRDRYTMLTEQMFRSPQGIEWLGEAMAEHGDDMFNSNALEMARRVGKYELLREIQSILQERENG